MGDHTYYDKLWTTRHRSIIFSKFHKNAMVSSSKWPMEKTKPKMIHSIQEELQEAVNRYLGLIVLECCKNYSIVNGEGSSIWVEKR